MTKQKKSIVQTPTKGKGGKGSKGGKSEAVDLKECPLEFRIFESVDSGSAPNYFSLLKRSPSEDIGLEDLDGLQLELENLLSSSVLRRRYYKDESNILSNLDKYKGKVNKKVSIFAQFKQLQNCQALVPNPKPISPQSLQTQSQPSPTQFETQINPKGTGADTKIL